MPGIPKLQTVMLRVGEIALCLVIFGMGLWLGRFHREVHFAHGYLLASSSASFNNARALHCLAKAADKPDYSEDVQQDLFTGAVEKALSDRIALLTEKDLFKKYDRFDLRPRGPSAEADRSSHDQFDTRHGAGTDEGAASRKRRNSWTKI